MRACVYNKSPVQVDKELFSVSPGELILNDIKQFLQRVSTIRCKEAPILQKFFPEPARSVFNTISSIKKNKLVLIQDIM